jgi:hypothetical protein
MLFFYRLPLVVLSFVEVSIKALNERTSCCRTTIARLMLGMPSTIAWIGASSARSVSSVNSVIGLFHLAATIVSPPTVIFATIDMFIRPFKPIRMRDNRFCDLPMGRQGTARSLPDEMFIDEFGRVIMRALDALCLFPRMCGSAEHQNQSESKVKGERAPADGRRATMATMVAMKR